MQARKGSFRAKTEYFVKCDQSLQFRNSPFINHSIRTILKINGLKDNWSYLNVIGRNLGEVCVKNGSINFMNEFYFVTLIILGIKTLFSETNSHF
jgi:hypothetical protein